MSSQSKFRLLPSALALATVAAVGVAFVILNGVEPPPPPPPTAVIDCRMPVPSGERLDCGAVRVPEHWALADSPSLSLFYAIARATGPNPRPDPLVIVADGPGLAAGDGIKADWKRLADLRRDRDIIYLDQRGTGRSIPDLSCPELSWFAIHHGNLTNADAEACLKRLKSGGYDPAAFSTYESARDLAALRRALGFERWSLAGTGYGTVLAVEVARLDRKGVRSLVLDSPTLARASTLDSVRMEAIEQAFHRLFADCAADPGCAAAAGSGTGTDLEAAFRALTIRLNTTPLTVKRSVQSEPVLDHWTLANVLADLTDLLGSTDRAGRVPWLIRQLLAASADPAILSAHTINWLTEADQPMIKLAMGLNAAVICREVQPWIEPRSARSSALTHLPFVSPDTIGLEHDVFCPAWALPPLTHDELATAEWQPAVPTLLLTGAYDTITPSVQAEVLARSLTGSTVIRFAGLGHDVISGAGPCAVGLIATFLNQPETGPILPPCAAALAKPHFVTPDTTAATAPAAQVPAPLPPVTKAPVSTVPAPPPPVATSATPAQPSPPAQPIQPTQVATLSPPTVPSPLPISAATSTQCNFQVPQDEFLECGRLRVPENWNHPEGVQISLFFAVARSATTSSRAEPLLILNGGPGQAGSDLIASDWIRMMEIRKTRDVVYVDQRGTGRSQPALFCSKLNPVNYWHGGLTPQDALDCLRPFKDSGHDPAAFNTTESARDLIALRKSLGIARWNVLGTSYGTILAMELARQDTSAAIRSIVLNSPTSPRASWLDLDRMRTIQTVYQQVFNDCAADPACAASYPELDHVFRDLALILNAAPLPFNYTDPRNGITFQARFTFTHLTDIMTMMIGNGTGAAQVPSLLTQIHQITLGQSQRNNALLAWLYMPYWRMMDVLAYGLNAAIGCSEVRPWVNPVKARAEAAAYQPYVMAQSMELDYDVFCPAWNLPKVPEAFREPVTSAAPTLLLTGTYDTLTPTSLAESLASTLSSSQILRFRGLGHDVFSVSACARDSVARFLADPAHPVPTSCVEQSAPPRFVPAVIPPKT
ncbi:hypothetical protein WCLP8_250020 [uncultured Gammaproteobacteria bacterium]